MAKIVWGTLPGSEAGQPAFKANPLETAILISIGVDDLKTEVFNTAGSSIITDLPINDVAAALVNTGSTQINWAVMPSVDIDDPSFQVNPTYVLMLTENPSDDQQTLLWISNNDTILTDLQIDAVEALLEN